jgi:predicted metal-binding membrane protein
VATAQIIRPETPHETGDGTEARRTAVRLLWPWIVAASAWCIFAVATAVDQAYVLEHHTWVAWYLLGRAPLWAVLVVFCATWYLMLAAMMILPSLAVLGSVAKGSRRQVRRWRRRLIQPAFLGGFTLIWALFGALAFLADSLVRWLAGQSVWLAERPWIIGVATIVLAGVYQLLTPKELALRACHAQSHRARAARLGSVRGALRLGIRYGVVCLAADWALMVIMFGVGMTSLIWLGALTVLMLVEHTASVASWGRDVAALSGVALLIVATVWALPRAQAELAPGAAATSGQGAQTQHVGAESIALYVAPAAYGTNSFTVLVRDAQNTPVDDATVTLSITMVDMDMGTQVVALAPLGEAQPGDYQGTGDLTMPGRWDITIQVRTRLTDQTVQAVFHILAAAHG